MLTLDQVEGLKVPHPSPPGQIRATIEQVDDKAHTSLETAENVMQLIESP